jgi:hypothetical protein
MAREKRKKEQEESTFENLCLGKGNAKQGEVFEEETEAEGAGEEGAQEEGRKSASCRISGPVSTFTMKVTIKIYLLYKSHIYYMNVIFTI